MLRSNYTAISKSYHRISLIQTIAARSWLVALVNKLRNDRRSLPNNPTMHSAPCLLSGVTSSGTRTILPLRGLILHRMLYKDIFEASFLFLSHYPKRVSKEIANTFNLKTTHYLWLQPLLNPLSSPFHLHGGNFLPPELTVTALFQHINPCNFSRSLEISLKFSVKITDPLRSWIMCNI